MPISQLSYVSRVASGTTTLDVRDVLAVSRTRNAMRGVTGFLLYLGDAYVQVLEGPAREVTALFTTIARDPRHEDLVLVGCRHVTEPSFGDWQMGFVTLDPATRQGLEARVGSPFLLAGFDHDELLAILLDCAAKATGPAVGVP